MTRRSAQDVSMMMDNELTGDELHEFVQHLRNDEQLKSSWEHYHLIGDALRKNLPPFVLPDLSNRISAALQNEPAYFLPQQKQDGDAREARVPRRRAAVSFALAASVTALAVVGVMQLNGGDASQAPGMQPMTVAARDAGPVETAPAVAEAVSGGAKAHAPVVYASVTSGANAAPYGGEAGVDYPGEAADLYDYLVNYQKYAQTVSLQGGFYPTVQLVGYSPQ